MKQAIAENYIFDVDGTLYSQKNVRIKMFFRLVRFYGLRMHRLKELHALYCFRKLREKEDCRNKNFEDLFLKNSTPKGRKDEKEGGSEGGERKIEILAWLI